MDRSRWGAGLAAVLVVALGACGTGGTAAVSDVGRTAGVPDGSRSPAVPDGSRSPAVPDGSRSPGAPDGSRSPGVPDGSRSPGAPDGSRSPAVSDGASGRLPVPVLPTPASQTPSTDTSSGKTLAVGKSDLGTILVDEDGMTVYSFTKDSQGSGTSACTGSCLEAWPPVPAPATAGTGVDAAKLGSITRDDGRIQTTYNGWPLYYYAPDIDPGETKGQGVGKVWWMLDPTGKVITDER